jgi:hypothetical protein
VIVAAPTRKIAASQFFHVRPNPLVTFLAVSEPPRRLRTFRDPGIEAVRYEGSGLGVGLVGPHVADLPSLGDCERVSTSRWTGHVGSTLWQAESFLAAQPDSFRHLSHDLFPQPEPSQRTTTHLRPLLASQITRRTLTTALAHPCGGGLMLRRRLVRGSAAAWRLAATTRPALTVTGAARCFAAHRFLSVVATISANRRHCSAMAT